MHNYKCRANQFESHDLRIFIIRSTHDELIRKQLQIRSNAREAIELYRIRVLKKTSKDTSKETYLTESVRANLFCTNRRICF